VAQFLASGALFAFRHRETLINRFLPGPAEDGFFRLLARWSGGDGESGWAPLVGPGLGFTVSATSGAIWTSRPGAGLTSTTTLQLHPEQAAWAWRVRVVNAADTARRVEVFHGQDLGLADEGVVRNNEAYNSHYIDLLPVEDSLWGWVVLARQNQPMAGGRHPWLALGCASGASAFCTDGWQFFGADHRLTGRPAAIEAPGLPSRRLQYEYAMGGLQSRVLDLPPGGVGEIVFVGCFSEDHPGASSAADLARLHEVLSSDWPGPAPSGRGESLPASVFIQAGWIHGDRPTERNLSAWFPGERRHVERAADGAILSFFHGPDRHVVTRDKEVIVARPHGHILRSGEPHWIDSDQFGLTCYAAGIFSAQAYLGNPSLGRLLTVVRDALNLGRACGQRVFVRRDGQWRQLGAPSAFAMTPGDAHWVYRLGREVVKARVWCSPGMPASFLELRVAGGRSCEFLITHQLALGAEEFEHPGEAEMFSDAGWIGCRPRPESPMGQSWPEARFAIAASRPEDVAALGGSRLLYEDEVERDGPYAVLRTRAVTRFGVILLGSHRGPGFLPDAVAAARAEFAARCEPARPPPPPVRLVGGADPGIPRLDEVLPWFTHNAAIHFSAPHGLEQYGGGAWGVRDVCQGSVEWLLAAGRHDVVRRILQAVFAQQYPRDGSWPQWFMFPPFRSIQQAHSHGDVCFWPVKALCDYVEASNDVGFLQARLGYTDPRQFEPSGPEETLWTHCDRVIDHVESRFVAGTALVNYGDGDWDDTLQPADPAMRTHMVSAWTVGLAYHTFGQLAAVCRRVGEPARGARLEQLLARMRADFAAHLMAGGIVAGFMVVEPAGERLLLHPRDAVTGIRYRLLPMTRAVLAGLFTPEEARRHLQLVRQHLLYPDGARLMSEPAPYRGGLEKLFKRADTAANVGREVGLQYVHAHLRYAEALARLGEADGLWTALQVVNPVGLREIVAHAAPRQSNVYFSSSDADFADRGEAAAQWEELRTGRVAVRGGWRLYSSGPGLFLHQVRSGLLGLRESFGDMIFDPVLPRQLDGLVAAATVCGRPVAVRYRVREGSFSPRAITVNGRPCTSGRREANPYRPGGWAVAQTELQGLLKETGNLIEIDL